MSDIHKKSLALMDEYLESVSNEVFIADYLSVEESKGPLVKDFLAHNSFGEEYYTIDCNPLYKEVLSDDAQHMQVKKIQSNAYNGLYYPSANDDNYKLAA